MNNVALFIEKLKSNTEFINFEDTITVIDENYVFTPTAFKNGNQYNNVGENNGSCKIFAFANLNWLTENETLRLFGRYYQDVLDTPDNTDHQNIRNFMQFGWSGIVFEGNALVV
ncbi:MAG: HopJ type III effector protein [Bacteroidota bacterium]